ncbi:unnamed protein product [Linum trigynum]|uniref:Transposase (putative) gypsy type domain-containing protein n=1 Tax=Linum trigynum TaxID=586398 RepID=A0AAV2E0R8_9ROSI
MLSMEAPLTFRRLCALGWIGLAGASTLSPIPASSSNYYVPEDGSFKMTTWENTWPPGYAPCETTCLPTNVAGPERNSTISPSWMTSLITDLGLPRTWTYAPPSPIARVGLCGPRWLGIYQEYFRFGLRFPLDPILEGILEYCECTIGRLSPSVILIITLFKLKCRIHNVRPTFNLFRHFFTVTPRDNCLSLVRRKKVRAHFVTRCPKLWRTWFTGFFFVKAHRDFFFASGDAFRTDWELGEDKRFNAAVTLSQEERDGVALISGSPVDLRPTRARAPILNEYYGDGVFYANYFVVFAGALYNRVRFVCAGANFSRIATLMKSRYEKMAHQAPRQAAPNRSPASPASVSTKQLPVNQTEKEKGKAPSGKPAKTSSVASTPSGADAPEDPPLVVTVDEQEEEDNVPLVARGKRAGARLLCHGKKPRTTGEEAPDVLVG